ncbi:Protein of unknown function [Virgibacillus subterraneus]|uniref:DUF1657 domain-containing protein n=2 Tax=Virgibacillus TaxID=84406 RepID=A0A1H1CNV8_9BACI|nr:MULTISPECIES: DUF1657 domain-containing protein [Virgibacillus]SDQ65852.1 Protein of unknown function [Virgibacillus salinus]SEQ64187.1 Protein of unknown function [Virgibacillus subterraneus]
MTVGSQVKGCFSSIKSVEATLLSLENKTQNPEARECFHEVQSIISDIKTDLEKQVIYLSQQEPQYKN